MQGSNAATHELAIGSEDLGFIIVKAREFDAKVDPVEPDPASNPSDDDECGILEDYPDDATLAELRAAIMRLNEDALIDLIALVWLGRGDFAADEWEEARLLAKQRNQGNSSHYLLGMPLLGDLLEEGLAVLGIDCPDSAGA